MKYNDILSSLLGYLLSRFDNKRVIVAIAIFVNALMSLWTSLARSSWEMYVCRFLDGFAKGPVLIYAPVWVDEFSPDQYATVWIALLQANVALGIMFGYLFGGLTTTKNFGSVWWRYILCYRARLI